MTKPKWRDVTNYSMGRGRYGEPIAFEIEVAGVTIDVQHFARAEDGPGWYMSCRGGLTLASTKLLRSDIGAVDQAKHAALRVVQERVQQIDHALGLAGGER